MNGVDIAVVIIVLIFVILVLTMRFILPRIMNRRLRKNGKDSSCECSKCKRY